MTLAEPTSRRWSFEEYYQMAELGFFQGQRVELIGGEIVEMAPQGNFHSVAVGLGQRAMLRVFGSAFWVREQLPMRFTNQHSEPEPDVSVVPGEPRHYLSGHPDKAEIIIEVSETTLAYDRGRKASLYASCGIQDYWIVDLINRQVEQHRNPITDVTQAFGWRFDQIRIFKGSEALELLALPGQQVLASELLP